MRGSFPNSINFIFISEHNKFLSSDNSNMLFILMNRQKIALYAVFRQSSFVFQNPPTIKVVKYKAITRRWIQLLGIPKKC